MPTADVRPAFDFGPIANASAVDAAAAGSRLFHSIQLIDKFCPSNATLWTYGAPYVQSVALDGQNLSMSWIEWNSLDPAAAASTALAFAMGPKSNAGRTSAVGMVPAIAGTGYTAMWNRAS